MMRISTTLPTRRRGLTGSLPGICLVAAATAWAGVCGCSTSKSLQVRKIDVVTGPPANVAVYMKVSREDGQPVTLDASNFSVYEDGKAVKGVRRALLPTESAVDRFVLVLVDLSGPLADSEYLPSLHDELATLATRLGREARLGLGAFDGDGVKFFLELEERDRARGLAAMRKFRPGNRNVDLLGAFITGLDKLDEASRQSAVSHREKTLILVTDRRDKAGRHSVDEVKARIEKSKTEVHVIGIGNAIDREALESLGKSGALFADQPRDLQRPFVDLADKLESKLAQDYVFAYCSPKRDRQKSAKHALQIRIKSRRWQGTLEHTFSARGFGREECDPSSRVSFAPQVATETARATATARATPTASATGGERLPDGASRAGTSERVSQRASQRDPDISSDRPTRLRGIANAN